MHTLGKVLLFFVIAGAGAATVLSAKLLDTREKWQKKIVGVIEKVEEQQPELEAKRIEFERLKQEIDRAQIGWNQEWTGVNINVDDANAGIVQANNLGRGPNSGQFGVSVDPAANRLPIVYIFHIDNGGKSTYLGEFQTTRVLDTSSEFRLVQPPFTNDPANPNKKPNEQTFDYSPALLSSNWPQGSGTFRVRMMIPAGYPNDFSGRILTLKDDQKEYDNRQRRLTNEIALLEEARRQRNQRMAELLGTDFLPDGRLSPEERASLPALAMGYIEAVRQEDAQRNKVLRAVDILRRKVKKAKDALKAVSDENAELSKQLPTPPN